MDYRKAWDDINFMVVAAVEEGQFHGFDKGSENYYAGMYVAYKRVLDRMKKLESEEV